MSLAVWLPLNGSLENQGYSTAQVTNNGATIDNNGKIGKCYYFNGTSTNYMTTTYSTAIGTNDFSIAMWVKIPTLTSGSYYALCTSKSATAASAGFGIYWNYSQKKFLWSTADGSSATEIWMANTVDTIVYDKWIHLVMVRNNNDNKKGYFYINGVRYELASVPVIRNITTDTKMNLGRCTNNTYFAKMYLNDFRIYDHALSPLEVKEISQGLVLHYKLNGNDWGNPNLLANSKLGGSWAYPSSSYSDKYSPITTSIPSASQYTLSFEAKSTVNGDKIRTHYYSPNTTTTCVSNQGVSKSALDGNMDFTLTTNWKKYWVIYSQNETTAVKHIICPRLVSGQGTGTVSVRNVKLEEGSVATPWCPNSADELYKILGIDATKILDSSGYNNNGTIINTPTISSDTPRYNNCLHISAVNQKVQISNIITSGFGNSYTIAWWGKCATFSGTMHWGFSDGVRLNGIFNGNLWNTGDSGQNPLYKPGTTTQVTAPSTGVWHHFAMTGDGTNCKVYLDGEYWGIAKTYKSISGTSIYLNGWNSSTSYSNSDLSLSDFRVYCTALSATDIKLLYSAGARADNLGGLHVQEFEEGARKGITTQRILHSSNFYESGYLELLHYDKNVYTEPDGTTWVHIFHHNDPTTNGLFASTDNFETSVYKNEHKWYDIEPLMANMPMYEFMVKQKTTSSATEVKYRWIQNVNPLEATWADVKPGTVTFNTSSGYTSSSFGGLWKMNSYARMCIANGGSGNWYGALGSWTVYQTNQVPGFPNTSISTGYIDLYIRIYTPIKFIKDTGTNALNFIEV